MSPFHDALTLSRWLSAGCVVKQLWASRTAFLHETRPFDGKLLDVFVGDKAFTIERVSDKGGGVFAVELLGSALLGEASRAAGVVASVAVPPAAASPAAVSPAASAAPLRPEPAAAAGVVSLSGELRGSLLQAAARAWPVSEQKGDHVKYLIARWMINSGQPDAFLTFKAELTDLGKHFKPIQSHAGIDSIEPSVNCWHRH